MKQFTRLVRCLTSSLTNPPIGCTPWEVLPDWWDAWWGPCPPGCTWSRTAGHSPCGRARGRASCWLSACTRGCQTCARPAATDCGCTWETNVTNPIIVREREMFYLTTHSTHFIYGYMASDIWLRTILRVRKETRCCHIGYSYRLTARVLLYATSHREDNTYNGLCYTSRGALAGMRNSSMANYYNDQIIYLCFKNKVYV